MPSSSRAQVRSSAPRHAPTTRLLNAEPARIRARGAGACRRRHAARRGARTRDPSRGGVVGRAPVRVDPARRCKRQAPGPRRSAELARELQRSNRRPRIRPAHGLVRRGGLQRGAGDRRRHRDRSALAVVSRTCTRPRSARLLVDADPRRRWQRARHLRQLLSDSKKPHERRPRGNRVRRERDGARHRTLQGRPRTARKRGASAHRAAGGARRHLRAVSRSAGASRCRRNSAVSGDCPCLPSSTSSN